MQKKLSEIVSDINKELAILNQIPQSVRNFDLISLPQWFIHHYIEKISYVKKEDRKTHIRKHIPNSALPDGVHQSRNQLKWDNHLEIIKNKMSSWILYLGQIEIYYQPNAYTNDDLL